MLTGHWAPRGVEGKLDNDRSATGRIVFVTHTMGTLRIFKTLSGTGGFTAVVMRINMGFSALIDGAFNITDVPMQCYPCL